MAHIFKMYDYILNIINKNNHIKYSWAQRTIEHILYTFYENVKQNGIETITNILQCFSAQWLSIHKNNGGI